MSERQVHRVHLVRHLCDSAFVLRFDRHGLAFEPGQYLNLGVQGSLAMREYSIYSTPADDFLEVLVREIPGGMVSPALKRARRGDALSVQGPYGMFVTRERARRTEKYLFIGSGTGISPFHCLARSYPEIDYLLLHGVRSAVERFDEGAFEPSRFLRCVSRSEGGDYRGRVSGWLREHGADPRRLCYLCGNSDMIYEVYGILKAQGVSREQIFAEVYF